MLNANDYIYINTDKISVCINMKLNADVEIRDFFYLGFKKIVFTTLFDGFCTFLYCLLKT